MVGKPFSLAALVVLALPALADARQPTDPVEKAKQAGIRVDPAAEVLMRKAPPGSCFSDLTQAKCGKADRVVRVYADADGYYELAPPGGDSEPKTGDRKPTTGDSEPTANAAAAPDCQFVHSGLFKTPSQVGAWASHECFVPIARHEVYDTLYKYYRQVWHVMTTAADAYNGKRWIIAQALWNCVSTGGQQRSWHSEASAYTKKDGIWYGVSDTDTKAFVCG